MINFAFMAIFTVALAVGVIGGTYVTRDMTAREKDSFIKGLMFGGVLCAFTIVTILAVAQS